MVQCLKSSFAYPGQLHVQQNKRVIIMIMSKNGAVFRKLICISRSSAHTAESEVMCLVTFLGVQVTREKQCWYKIFCLLNQNGLNAVTSFIQSLTLQHEKLLQTQNGSVLLNFLCFGRGPHVQRFAGQCFYYFLFSFSFQKVKNSS